MANGHYGPTPLRIVEHGGRTYLGGGCRRFGCDHTFVQHDHGRPDGGPTGGGSGGKCYGTVKRMAGSDEPCKCTEYLDAG